MALHRILTLALLASATLFGGCVYRPDIQQGNLLSVKDIEQVTVGMTRSQVRYLLGTPMVSDPFAPQRWDYVYRMQYGRSRTVDSAHFIVYFEGDKVARVQTVDVVEPQQRPSDALQGSWNPFRKKTPEPAVPSSTPPPPPGG